MKRSIKPQMLKAIGIKSQRLSFHGCHDLLTARTALGHAARKLKLALRIETRQEAEAA